MADKPKVSVYWAASCGGCEISVVNLHEKFLELDKAFDFMFCPCLLDTKVKAVEALPDGSIAVTLFNGSIRTKENEEMATFAEKVSLAGCWWVLLSNTNSFVGFSWWLVGLSQSQRVPQVWHAREMAPGSRSRRRPALYLWHDCLARPRPASSLGVSGRGNLELHFSERFQLSCLQVRLAKTSSFRGICSRLQIGFLKEVAPALVALR